MTGATSKRPSVEARSDLLWEPDALRRFTAEAAGPMNIARMPETPSPAELAALCVARVSWAIFL
jgi:hypothetical protein